MLSTHLSLLFPLLPLFSRDVLTLLSRLRLSSEELIVAGAYSWSSTTPTCRARGEHPRYTTGTLISENSAAFLSACLSLEAREKKSVRELCKFKLAKFLMEIVVTPEWSCLELKHCCNQYRPSWGWRARTFRSPFVENNGDNCYFSQTCCKLPNMAGALQVMMLSEGKEHKEVCFFKSRVWSCSGFTGHRGDVAAVDQLHLKSGLGCSFFTPRDEAIELSFSKTISHFYCFKLTYDQLTLVLPKYLKKTTKCSKAFILPLHCKFLFLLSLLHF